ncbi:Hypothetical protein PHPALM_15449 [Phytophthora palmivora]|uniref:Uncharacterized protein n=1 Tax=Phytophthora palmivora TaxID=4796 RepID=A0A2P4XS57_9STRA|nr:Hypothetical protein PHPALM_15449 [Phytophthora palmivora]
MPDLMKIQKFVYYHKKTNMKNSDLVDDMIELVRTCQYSNELDDDISFAFGCTIDGSGNPVIGKRTDDDPCMIAVSTKTMLRQADRTSESFNFHMDATFKLNTVEYPVFVCGVSDVVRHFHPVAFFITSQRITLKYKQALQQISEMFMRVVGNRFKLKISWPMQKMLSTMDTASLLNAMPITNSWKTYPRRKTKVEAML